jgi:hypothetical protein
MRATITPHRISWLRCKGLNLDYIRNKEVTLSIAAKLLAEDRGIEPHTFSDAKSLANFASVPRLDYLPLADSTGIEPDTLRCVLLSRQTPAQPGLESMWRKARDSNPQELLTPAHFKCVSSSSRMPSVLGIPTDVSISPK